MTKPINPASITNQTLMLSVPSRQPEKQASCPPCPAWTIAGLVREVETWGDLHVRRQSVLKSNIRTAGLAALAAQARIAGRTVHLDRRRADDLLANVPADPAWLNTHLYAFPAAVVGTKKQTLASSVSGLRHVMRRIGLMDLHTSEAVPVLDQHWQELLGKLDNSKVFCCEALENFAIWCCTNGIAPGQVSPDSLEGYEAHVRTRMLHSEIRRLIRNIAKSWRKAALLLREWPQQPLTASPRRDTYTLPWSTFPASLQDDVNAFRRRLEGSGTRKPFGTTGLRRPLRPASVKARLYSLRQAASALVLLGREPATLTALADLVDAKAFDDILRFFWDRAVAAAARSRSQASSWDGAGPSDPDQGRTSQTGSIASALMTVAKYHCGIKGEALEQLRDMAQDVTPSRQTELSQKNRDRLRQFAEPARRARLLHLPQRLMRLAEQPGLRPFEAARLARIAVAIEVLFHIPLRVGNLSALRIGVHLRHANARQGAFTHLMLQPHETKNHRYGEWTVGPELSAFLNHYISRFRPILAMVGGDYLFPAGFGEDGPLSEISMATQIKKAIAEEVGAIVNPHLFRCLCASFVLEHSPGALEDVRLLIGDKSLAVVLAHYAAIEPAHACRRHDELLRRMRDGSRHLAAPSTKPAKPAKPARKLPR